MPGPEWCSRLLGVSLAKNDSKRIVSLGQLPTAIRINWADGHTSLYHYIWLRDNCACAACGPHSSGSRFQALLDIPDDIAPSQADHDEFTTIVTWAGDGHRSCFDGGWLRQHCYSCTECARRGCKKTLWDSSLTELPAVDYRLAQSSAREWRLLFANVAEYGFVVIKNMGVEYHEIERLAARIGYVRNTHFGPVTDLTLRNTPGHLSDFPTGILPHTDETYRPVPTGINIFHCIKPSDDGGGASMLVDAHQCAAQMRTEHPDAFRLLSSLPIQHERRASDEIIRSRHPAFTLDWEGNIMEVRLNERTMSGLALPDNLMQRAYQALRLALRLAYNSSNRITYHLEAGEALVFDNLRVLHGRTGFSGERLIRQSNVMRDEFYAKLAFLDEVSPPETPNREHCNPDPLA